ncbi:16S rRNA (cytidine(1402)-2'-O)-methyltransferase [Siculibacillus lacustris]|uniref:Ribosomal RNA small subunit methyltransferase I n=1 Tax=Siculibacillus lacustris TaxID=1549641 RepID=A0A4Q9VKS3_9HYPH|nr:16S rRNA (cytidine(1402)-2'-O)-methyltransferase [Siculibacillus lacustris]TBW35778.1 16S rRNA (cytidine(1402)-2'-O)-methyltransferase [Siculibacillus lacustris]
MTDDLPTPDDRDDLEDSGGDEGRHGFRIGAAAFPAHRLDPGLHVVATPIGHLGDVSLRALETLAAADLVACEDTRTTRVLLDRYGIRNRLISYNDHNAGERRPRLLAALAEGKVVALVSDAGTPLVSDPGYRLVADCVAAGHRVIPVPGASAMLAALVLSGLPTDAFLFAGFLSARAEARRRRIEELARVPATLIFYESPHRLAESLADLVAVLGADRPAVVARELTKTFEETVRGTLGELAGIFATRTVKGEVVLMVGAPAEIATSEADVDAMLRAALARLAPGPAVAEVARLTGADRRTLYARSLELRAERGGGR